MFIVLVIFLFVLIYLVHNYKKKFSRAEEKIASLEELYKKTLNQKKSSEVRLGKTAENMAPFFQEWPYDPRNFRFLGDPVDGISFEKDQLLFIEIKSGKSRLSTGQREIKKLIKEGKVKFATFRIDENGCTLRVEE